MITSRLQGGLGNQMFQIAAAVSLAKELGSEAKFDFNTCHTPAQGFTSNKYRENIFKNLTDAELTTVRFNGVYTEPKFSYQELPKTDNIILHGYFQSEKYFKKHKEHIINLFDYRGEEYDKAFEFLEDEFDETDRITAVHVRRGDYLKNPDYHPVCSIEYYKKGMDMTYDNNMKYLFLSDDMKWCKENFKGDNIHYSPFTSEIEDFYLLTLCDNHIIANSSFSWWGAYIAEGDKVIAPKNWFGKNGPKDVQDLIPKDWILI
jgi:hypothetical protein